MLIFSGAFIAQAGFGMIIGRWHADAQGHYPVIAYRVGFAVLIALQLPGVVRYGLARMQTRRGPAPRVHGAPLATVLAYRPQPAGPGRASGKISAFSQAEDEYEVGTLRSSR